MAVTEDVPGLGIGKVINLDHSVGRGCQNWMGDVSFVQLALSEIFGSPSWQGMMKNLPQTGACDETTIAWIWLYQCLSKRVYNAPIMTDQRVDRAEGAVGPVHHQVYTIWHLNLNLADANPALYASLLEQHKRLP